MKGIILAGGSGTRLYPLTMVTSKQLLPVYDKPMIYYPLSVLMLAGIKDILIISTPVDLPKMEALLGDGENLGIHLSYKVQEKPEGLAQAFVIGKEFIGDDSVAMILGDNIYHGAGLLTHFKNSVMRAEQGISTIYGYIVKDPQRFGIVEMDENGNALSIEEKPQNPKSNYCVTGLYFYPKGVSEVAEKIEKSARGEYEITTLNEYYLKQNKLHVTRLGTGYTWIDAGTCDSLIEAGNYCRMIEKHQGIHIACLEEIAFFNGWISKECVLEIAQKMENSEYGKYLEKIATGKIKYFKY